MPASVPTSPVASADAHAPLRGGANRLARLGQPWKGLLLLGMALGASMLSVVVIETAAIVSIAAMRGGREALSVESLRRVAAESGYLYRQRLLGAEDITGWSIPDPVLGFRNRPGAFFYTIDAGSGRPSRFLKIGPYGFIQNRSGDADEPVTASTFNVFVTGGSTVAGGGATTNETTFPSVLERILSERVPPGRTLRRPVRVVNAGVGGYRSSQEMIYIAFDLMYLHPGLVVMFNGINEGWGDRLYATNWHYGRGQGGAAEPPRPAFGLLPATRELARMVADRIEPAPPPPAPGYTRLQLGYRRPVERYRQTVEEAAGVVTSQGVPFMYVLQPTSGVGRHRYTREELALRDRFILPPDWAAYAEGVGGFLAEVRRGLPEMRARHGGNRRVAFLDATGLFDDVRESVYYDPRHYNDRGHRIIAEYLHGLIVRQLGSELYR